MNIFFDTSVMSLFPNGISVYEQQLLLALNELDVERELHFYTGISSLLPRRHRDFMNGVKEHLDIPLSFVRSYCPARYAGKWPSLRRGLTWGGARYDLCHAPANGLPEWVPFPGGVPLVMTVHDLAFWRAQDGAGGENYRRLMEKTLLPHLSRAALILTDSEFSRREIITLLSVPAERVYAVPLATQFGADIPAAEPGILSACGLAEQQYFLSVGLVLARKNYPGLIAAFRKYKASHPASRQKLVIVGRPAPGTEPIQNQIRHGGEDVIWRTSVTTPELIALYRHAAAMFLVSRYEGFGLPVLEAMQCGCPVCFGTGSSLDELCPPETAIPVHPDDGDAIAAAMARLTEDYGWRTALSEAGRRQAASYSWRRTAERTLHFYRCAAEGKTP